MFYNFVFELLQELGLGQGILYCSIVVLGLGLWLWLCLWLWLRLRLAFTKQIGVKQSKKADYKIVGAVDGGNRMYEQIDQLKSGAGRKFPKYRIKSIKAERGTEKFLKEALKSDEEIPSYWSLNTPKYILSIEYIPVPKLERTIIAINKLVENLWDSKLVGKGSDAIGIQKNSRIKIIKVERLENLDLFVPYKLKRKELLKKRLCPDIATIRMSAVDNNSLSSSGVLSTLKLSNFMKIELLCSEINEHYLFHGCKSSVVNKIKSEGFDPRVSNGKSMFGKGVYFAENPTKSDQYADIGNRQANGTEQTMILARVLIGDTFLCGPNYARSQDSDKIVRPPCKTCLKDKCLCQAKTNYDSLLYDGKAQGKLFREFVVYERHLCYPEYFITYVRV